MATGGDKGFKISDDDRKCIDCGSIETIHYDWGDGNSERRCEDCGLWFTRCQECGELATSIKIIHYSGFNGIPGLRKMGNEISREDLSRMANKNDGVYFDGDDRLTSFGKKGEDGWMRDGLDLKSSNCEEAIESWKCTHCGAETVTDLLWTAGFP